MIDLLRWIAASEGLLIFLVSMRHLPRFWPVFDRPLKLLACCYSLLAFAMATGVGVNAILNAPPTPGLFVALTLLTPAAALSATAHVLLRRQPH